VIEHWLTDPFQFEVQRRALLEVVVSGGLCGALGAYVILRRLGFMADALSHAVLPGVVIAYIRVGVGGVLYGALAAGILAASAIGLITRNRRVREDTAIGIVLTGGFALGIVLISTLRSYATALEDFLFGNVLLVSPDDLKVTLVLAGMVGVVMVLFHRRFVMRAFDPDTAEALGLNGNLLDLVLLMTLAATVVVALRSIGNILVVALLITPAATARLLTDRVLPMMLIGALLGAGSGVVGIIVAYQLNLATGALIVCVATVVFLGTLLLEPRRGLVGILRARRRRDVTAVGAPALEPGVQAPHSH
jgi:manganese/iron transport system permease protein